MKKFVIVLLCFVFLGTIAFFPAIQVFSFVETRTDEPAKYYLKIDKEKQFQIIFTHSIHLTDVIESYEVLTNGNIKLVSMQYSNVAIGMPAFAEEGQTLIYEDGVYTLKYDNEQLEEFSLYIGDVDYDLKFAYKDEQFDLKEQLQRGKSYLFSIGRISLFDLMKGEKMDDER